MLIWLVTNIQLASIVAEYQTKDNTTVRVGCISDLQKAWNDDYVPQTLGTFIEAITANHWDFDLTMHYSKFTPIVQSSGVGKSRLVDEFSKKVLGILFTFRMSDDTGYPPGDPEIREYILDHMPAPSDKGVSRPLAVAASLIAASISTLHSLVRAGLRQGQCGNLLGYLHKEMAPVAVRVATERRGLSPTRQEIQGTLSLPVATGDRGLSPTGRQVQSTRSLARSKFCTDVSELARSILKEFANDATWETAINSDVWPLCVAFGTICTALAYILPAYHRL